MGVTARGAAPELLAGLAIGAVLFAAVPMIGSAAHGYRVTGFVGVDVKENSVSTYDIEDGINKAAIVRHSKKAYVVAEARKLSTDGNYNYTTLDTLSGLITDSLPAEDIREAADDYGIEIILP